MGTYEINLGKILLKYGFTLGVAESLTGGLLSKRITDISGSSNYFSGGVIVYSGSSKETVLKIPAEIINRFGTVSAQTAVELAKNVRKLFKCDVSISTTGIAGPTSVEDKPIGLVYVGVAVKEKIFSFEEYFSGTREQIREKTVNFALNKTIVVLKNGGSI